MCSAQARECIQHHDENADIQAYYSAKLDNVGRKDFLANTKYQKHDVCDNQNGSDNDRIERFREGNEYAHRTRKQNHTQPCCVTQQTKVQWSPFSSVVLAVLSVCPERLLSQTLE